jgi:hypothetical protein
MTRSSAADMIRGRVEWRRNDRIFFWMELGGHDEVRVSGEDGDAVAGGAVPYANCLVI